MRRHDYCTENEFPQSAIAINNESENHNFAAKIKAEIHRLSPHINFTRCKTIFKRIFPHLSTELAVIAIVLSVVYLSIGMTKTATIGQEMTLMQWGQLSDTITEPTDALTVPEPTQEAEFEISGSEQIIETQPIEYQTSQICFIGDSRTVAMEDAVLTSVHFITKSSAGLEWFNSTASSELEKIVEDIGLCVVALGINDIHNVEEYVTTLNAFAEKHLDKTFVYVNLGPVDEEKYTGIQNASLKTFNEKMQHGLSNRWKIVDQYAYLAEEGFSSEDGIHYSYQDSAKVFAWIVDSIKTQTIIITN